MNEQHQNNTQPASKNNFSYGRLNKTMDKIILGYAEFGYGRTDTLNILLFYSVILIIIPILFLSSNYSWHYKNYNERQVWIICLIAILYVIFTVVAVWSSVPENRNMSETAMDQSALLADREPHLKEHSSDNATESIASKTYRRLKSGCEPLLQYHTLSIWIACTVDFFVIWIIFMGDVGNSDHSKFDLTVIALLLYMIWGLVSFNNKLPRFCKDRVKRWEEIFLVFTETVIWTTLITFTGGINSHLYYMYILSLLPKLIVGSDKRRIGSIGAKMSTIEKANEWWINNPWSSIWFIIVLFMVNFLLNAETKEFSKETWKLIYAFGPVFFIPPLLIIMTETERKDVRQLISLMHNRDLESFPGEKPSLSTLAKTVAGGTLNFESYLCSSLLIIKFETQRDKSHTSEAIFVKDIEENKAFNLDERFPLSTVDLEKIKIELNKTLGLDNIDFPPKEYFRGFDQAFYDSINFPKLLNSCNLNNAIVEEFNDGLRSLCCVLVPSKPGSLREEWYLVFFKSLLPGNFDRNAALVYEALTVQSVGLHQKHVDSEKSTALAKQKEYLSDMSMTLLHDYVKKSQNVVTYFGGRTFKSKSGTTTLGGSSWSDMKPSQILDKKEWVAAVSAWLLNQNLNLIWSLSRYTTVMSREAAESISGDFVNIRKPLALGIWLAAAMDSDSESTEFGKYSWSELNHPDADQEFTKIIAAYFQESTKTEIKKLLDINLKGFVKEERIKLDDVWTMIFYEITRDGFGSDKVCGREIKIELYETAVQLQILTWYHSLDRNDVKLVEIEGNKGLRINNKMEYKKMNERIAPLRPDSPNAGWGRRGNYTLVEEMLEQEYRIFWTSEDSLTRYALGTSIVLGFPVYVPKQSAVRNIS